MSDLGKIFVYEKNTENLTLYTEKLEAQGFFTFGTDNIYQLLRYSELVSPDIIIMNLPQDFYADEKTWKKIENSLCRNTCPQIYINNTQHFANRPTFHYFDFQSSEVVEEQIIDILQNLPRPKYLQ